MSFLNDGFGVHRMECRALVMLAVMVKSINRTANKIMFTQLAPYAYKYDNMRRCVLCCVNTQIWDM